MEIKLKNIKFSEFASEETNCFEASVYVDGKKITSVNNGGKGGPNSYYPWNEDVEKLSSLAKQLPPSDISYLYNDGKEHFLDCNIDTIIDELMTNFLKRKDCKSKVMFRIPSEKYSENSWSSFKGKLTQDIREQVVKKYGVGTVFLEDSLPDVFKLNVSPKLKM